MMHHAPLCISWISVVVSILQLFEHEKEKMLSFKSSLSPLSASPEEALTDLVAKAKQEYASKLSLLSLTHVLPQENEMYVIFFELQNDSIIMLCR